MNVNTMVVKTKLRVRLPVAFAAVFYMLKRRWQ
jgi:hypothetical protein